jgi:hypothetical protein
MAIGSPRAASYGEYSQEGMEIMLRDEVLYCSCSTDSSSNRKF